MKKLLLLTLLLFAGLCNNSVCNEIRIDFGKASDFHSMLDDSDVENWNSSEPDTDASDDNFILNSVEVNRSDNYVVLAPDNTTVIINTSGRPSEPPRI